MPDKIRSDLKPNTFEYEMQPLITQNGFREYDARWLFGKELNLMGVQMVGLGLGTYFHELGIKPKVAAGHDYRSYEMSIKQALIIGLMQAGCEVVDIGLGTTPMGYFAQFALDCPGLAMVTASHNENGWTGVKMGAAKPLTFGPDEIKRLKAIVLGEEFKPRAGGSYSRVENFRAQYLDELTKGHKLSRPIKVTVACGNGTAGLFAPEALRRIGAEVTESECNPDYNFPNYNPNTEDLHMLDAMAKALKANGSGDRARLRCRRRPLRRGGRQGRGDLRRQDRRAAGARHVDRATRREIRRRCEIDRHLRDRSDPQAERRHDGLLDHRPFLHEAPLQGDRRAVRASRRAATIISAIRSAVAMTTASSPASRCSRCSTARARRRCPTSWPACPRPGARRPWRPNARTTRNTVSSTRW